MIKPFPFQEEGIDRLVDVLSSKQSALEASSTGYGKTFVSLFVAQRLGRTPAVLCPKSAIPVWQDASERMGIPLQFVTNYEQAKLKKFKHGGWKRKNQVYQWELPDQSLLIFDECHRLKNPKSQLSKLGVAVGNHNFKSLWLSATAAASPLDMFALGVALGIYSERREFLWWCAKYGVKEGNWGLFFDNTEPEHMLNLHHLLFPKYGHRKSVSDIPNFPENQIQTIQVVGKNTPRVKAYLDLLAETKLHDEPLPIVDLLRARQEAEALKVPSMIEQAKDLLLEGYSVAFFLCFKESFGMIVDDLSKHGAGVSRVYGGQSDRASEVEDFQSNKNHAIVCQIKAGGESINLHDLHGRPRVSLISPSYSAEELIQALGRIRRAGSQSKSIQKIFFCKGTVEERVRRSVQNKIDNIELLNDGDTNPFL